MAGRARNASRAAARRTNYRLRSWSSGIKIVPSLKSQNGWVAASRLSARRSPNGTRSAVYQFPTVGRDAARSDSNGVLQDDEKMRTRISNSCFGTTAPLG